YESCNFDINRNFLFQGDWMQPFHRLVPGILEKIPVLIYAGDADFICNWLGNRAWAEALEWPGKKAYNKVELKDLKLDGHGRKIGEVKSSGNFTFMRLYEPPRKNIMSKTHQLTTSSRTDMREGTWFL
ncbi:MAG: hypothetical protein M1830_009127, partial [Pleopsidium flavum]